MAEYEDLRTSRLRDGIIYGGDYSSPHFVAGTTEFTDYYLQQIVSQSVTAGKTLLDVFDTHYYTAGSSDALCLEAPRLFWDPNATDISATVTNSIDFNYGDHSYFDKNWYPRQMIPSYKRRSPQPTRARASRLPDYL